MKICSVEGCEKRHHAKGYCSGHLHKLVKYGDPTVSKQKQIHGATITERFLAYLGERPSEGCWEWQGYRDPNGYGRLNIDGKPMLAHRLSWELHCAPVPEGLSVLHKCDNPPCVNPYHLFIGTQLANIADMHRKGRARQGVSRGSEHGCAKLSEDQVREIRASADKRINLASRYGVSRRQMADIQNGKSWRHIL